MDWTESLDALRSVLEMVPQARATLEKFESEAAALIAKYARQAGGVELDVAAIKATITRPYTLLPINEHEAHIIHWRGVKLPIFGWVIKQEPAFTIARVTRSMDLLTPLPTWAKQELGWKPPEHKAAIDGTHTRVRLTEGDPGTFKRKYGAHLGKQNADGTFPIKSGDAWIKLVAQMVQDGILPYTATPVAKEHWNDEAEFPKILADIIAKKEKLAGAKYIYRSINEFREKGAVLVNIPPGAGKTLTAGGILNHFVGKVLILADTSILIEQWRGRVKLFAPDANATISTYQGAAKFLDEEWDLVIFDEAQRLPADTFSKLAFIKTKYRLGLTGTPWREDNRQHLIVALCGFPVALRWAEMIASGALKRPHIIVVTVPTEAAKTPFVKSLVSARKGRAIIFCDWIERGNEIANALAAPFIHGGTQNKLKRLEESDVAVVSRIGDRGLDLHDLRLVIEVAGQGAAREQFAQRVGRLLHGDFEGEFYTVFTPEEAQKFRGRVFGVEAELAGEVDIEFVTVGNVVEKTNAVAHVRSSHKAKASARPAKPPKPQSEMDQLLSHPTIVKLITRAEDAAGGWIKDRHHVTVALKKAWDEAVDPEQLKAIIAHDNATRYKKAYEFAERENLVIKTKAGYRTNVVEIKRLVGLAQSFKRKEGK